MVCAPELFVGDCYYHCFCIILADVQEDLLKECRGQLDNKVGDNLHKGGLAIVTGITIGGTPTGVKEDMQNMKTAFKSIGLAVWKLKNASKAKITGVLRCIAQYEFPVGYKFIIFYFSGHGGSLHNHPYICTDANVDGNQNKLYISEGIVSHLLPKQNPKLRRAVRRIFLFDSCLSDDTLRRVEQHTQEVHERIQCNDMRFSPEGNVLVAFSTSMRATAKADRDLGGVWTRNLAKNIVEMDLPLTTVLDVTWGDTVLHFNNEYEHEVRNESMSAQGPHYISCAGLIWLQRKCMDPFMVFMHSLSCSVHLLHVCADPRWDLKECQEFLPKGPLPTPKSEQN